MGCIQLLQLKDGGWPPPCLPLCASAIAAMRCRKGTTELRAQGNQRSMCGAPAGDLENGGMRFWVGAIKLAHHERALSHTHTHMHARMLRGLGGTKGSRLLNSTVEEYSKSVSGVCISEGSRSLKYPPKPGHCPVKRKLSHVIPLSAALQLLLQPFVLLHLKTM